MNDDDDDPRKRREEAQAQEARKRAQRRVSAGWTVAAALFVATLVLAAVAGDSKIMGAGVWLLSGLLTPSALLFAFSSSVRAKQRVPGRAQLARVVVAMLALLGFGLWWAWDVARRFW